MDNKDIKMLNDNLDYFKGIAKELSNPNMQNDSSLVNVFDDIDNHIATLSDNIDFSDAYDPADAISGDNGDIESGENMLFYYQQLVRDGDYDTSDTDAIYDYFVGGSKIKHDDCLYVNHIADEDEPADVRPVTPIDLRDSVVSDVIFDLKKTLAEVEKDAKETIKATK